MDNCIHIQLHKCVDSVFPSYDQDIEYHVLDYFNIFIVDDSVTNRKLFYGIDNDGLTYQFKDDEDTLRVIDELTSDGYLTGSTSKFNSQTRFCYRKSNKSLSEMLTNIYRVRHGKYMESLSGRTVRFRFNPRPFVRGRHFNQHWLMDRVSPLYEQFKNVRPDDDVHTLIRDRVYRGSKESTEYQFLTRKPTLSMMSRLRRRLVSLFTPDVNHRRELEQRECEDTLIRKGWYRSNLFKQLSPVR